ncbi:MAG: 16S rRNA (guanine(966)-N(2))-methyltransferase RsmD [Myxococcota bacterium]|nr:16S rRNA (guanine(966)-N(2))-methyltransferase RsmD [Myxococcota bacterium]
MRAPKGRGGNRLRVVAGSLGGRNLAPPPAGVRPTSDRVRESLFSILGDLSGDRVLDLYAGTGALGIEALSRGAESLVAVDRAQTSVRVVDRNLRTLGVAERSEVMRMECRAALRRLADEGNRFDLVFLDPPYADFDDISGVLDALVACDILQPTGVVVVEGPKRHSLPRVAGLSVERTRKYGDTVIYWLGLDADESVAVNETNE